MLQLLRNNLLRYKQKGNDTVMLKNNADRFFGRIQKIAWVLLSMMAIYIFAYVGDIYINPSDSLGKLIMVKGLLENLLSGCAVLLSGGVLFEYLSAE